MPNNNVKALWINDNHMHLDMIITGVAAMLDVLHSVQ